MGMDGCIDLSAFCPVNIQLDSLWHWHCNTIDFVFKFYQPHLKESYSLCFLCKLIASFTQDSCFDSENIETSMLIYDKFKGALPYGIKN